MWATEHTVLAQPDKQATAPNIKKVPTEKPRPEQIVSDRQVKQALGECAALAAAELKAPPDEHTQVITQIGEELLDLGKRIEKDNTFTDPTEELLRQKTESSTGMQFLTTVFPESAAAQIEYKYGLDPDQPNNAFDPKTGKIVLSINVEHVEEEMKYMAKNKSEVIECRRRVQKAFLETAALESPPLSDSLQTIAIELAEDPTTISYEDPRIPYLSYLGFRQLQEILEEKLPDKTKQQELYRRIYANALAHSAFAIDLLAHESDSSRDGLVPIAVHETSHRVNEQLQATKFPTETDMVQIQEFRNQYLERKHVNLDFYSENPLTVQELISINHELLAEIASNMEKTSPNMGGYLDVARRNARDEIIALTIETLGEKEPYRFDAETFAKYATGATHYFEGDPNIEIANLRQKLLESKTAEDKRRIIVDYLRGK